MNVASQTLQEAKNLLAAGDINSVKCLLYGAGVSPLDVKKFLEETPQDAEQEPPPMAEAIARKFVSLGANVIFFPRGTKACKTSGWEEMATNNLEAALRWAKQDPYANVGIVGKEDGLWGLDDDGGLLDEYIQKHGLNTYGTNTVSGGKHYIFRQDAASWAMGNISIKDEQNRELLSARIDNRYVVAAGSWAYPHNDESLPLTQYTAINPAASIVEAPQSLLDFIQAKATEWKAKKTKTATDASASLQVMEGGRNNYLTSRGGKLRDAGASHESILLELTRINESDCVPPLPSAEVESVARSVAKYKEGTPPLALNQKSANAPQPLTVPEGAASITEEATDPIPPFDASVVNGIYKRFVEVATRGTTMAPQFVYAIAKTFVGARMAGKVKFENLDVEPRFYTALIGETGSGKGEAWRRVFQILNCEAQIGNVSRQKMRRCSCTLTRWSRSEIKPLRLVTQQSWTC